MPVYLNDFIDILSDICKHKNVQYTAKSCLKGAAVTGAFSGLGGLILGPIGLAVGGAVGGVVAHLTSPKFISVPQILNSMSEKQKQELCDKVVYAFRDFSAYDLASVAALLLSQEALKMVAMEEVISYLNKEMGLQICK